MMVDKTFYGYSSDFDDPRNWSPVGVPQSGDVATIYMASAMAGGVLPAGVQIKIVSFVDKNVVSDLVLQDATVPAGTIIAEVTSSGSLFRSSLQFVGAVVNNGTLDLEGNLEALTLPSGTTLTNNGTINVSGSLQISVGAPTASLVNDGSIRFLGDTVVGTAIGGTGTVSVSVQSLLEFGGAVGGGQTLQFSGGTNSAASVQIDQPAIFAATIGGFVASNSLILANTASTSLSYAASGASSGTLQIYDGGSTPVASLSFSGNYASSDFSVSESGSSLVITTDVTDAMTGSKTAPTSSGVNRFFDTSDGTHFFTASVPERDNVFITRPDLVEESNAFGAVASARNATESVYRFFDTVHGTEFFTSNAAERDQVIATRGDLAYEPSSTFLEDAAPQAGDVAVYRLFSKQDGTHFYTSSTTELNALTTSGGAGYRADLVSEGVSFYAPAGSYT